MISGPQKGVRGHRFRFLVRTRIPILDDSDVSSGSNKEYKSIDFPGVPGAV
jgi:hypothetical protein